MSKNNERKLQNELLWRVESRGHKQEGTLYKRREKKKMRKKGTIGCTKKTIENKIDHSTRQTKRVEMYKC